MEGKKRLKIDSDRIPFLLYLGYILYVLAEDGADLVCYLLDLPQVTICSRVLICVGIVLLLLAVGKRVQIIKVSRNINVFWIIGSMVLIVFSVFKAIQPDLSSDTTNYHLVAQIPGFGHPYQDGFAAGSFQRFGGQLADHLFYIPRVLMGYRMGTLLNAAICVLIYYQVNNLLYMLWGSSFREIRTYCRTVFKQPVIPALLFHESMLSLVLVSTCQILMQISMYMVDLVPVPLLLELLRMILGEQEEKTIRFGYFAGLCGITAALKLTNVVYLLPLLICFIWGNRAYLTAKRFEICAVLGVLPFSIYAIYYLVETGSPIYPWFNGIFQSPFFLATNFKDLRWGPSNPVETLLWPIYAIVRPDYRQNEVYDIFPIQMFCAVIACICWVVVLRTPAARKRQHNEAKMLGIFICAVYLWALTTGHSRYFIFGKLLGGIIFCGLLVHFYKKKKGCLMIGLTLLAVCSLGGSVHDFYRIANGIEYAWRDSLNINCVKDNLNYIFRDHSLISDNQSADVDAVIDTQSFYGGIASCMFPDRPVYNYPYIEAYLPEGEVKEKATAEIRKLLESGSTTVAIHGAHSVTIEEYMDDINKLRLKLTDMDWLDGPFTQQYSMILCRLGPMDEDEANRLYFANAEGQDTMSIIAETGTYLFKALVSLNYNYEWFGDIPQEFVITASDGETEKTVFSMQFREREVQKVQTELDLNGLSPEIELKFHWNDMNGTVQENVGPYKLMIIPQE